MKWILTGHRGVGKSSLLKRIENYFPGIECIDLDRRIEDATGRTVSDIFKNDGEDHFRALEQELLGKILNQKNNFVLAVGAGCELFGIRDQYPEVEIIWVRRDTDSVGRVFLNRPSLNPGLRPLEQYFERYPQREERYFQWSHWVYTMPEGLSELPAQEKQLQREAAILKHSLGELKGCLTVLPENLRDEANRQCFARRFLHQQVSFFELRDDLLHLDLMNEFIHLFPKENIVFSLRSQNLVPDWVISRKAWIDWALELGPLPESLKSYQDRLILSLHEANDFQSGLAKIENLEIKKTAKHYKYSPFVRNWNDLRLGLEWQKRSPSTRSFLPRSIDGRWCWVRLYLKDRQLINFFREGYGSALDQPTLWQWHAAGGASNGKSSTRTSQESHSSPFAAVLGQPVFHSYSPVMHESFFRNRKMDFYAITIEKDDLEMALPILLEMGLSAAAVTAPLKEQFSNCKSINTLVREDLSDLSFAFTDPDGLRSLLRKAQSILKIDGILDEYRFCVWGGQGVNAAIQETIPGAEFFSSRTGERKISGEANSSKKIILIWAAPRSENTRWPSEDWNISLIVDLNYSESSMGRELAALRNIPYLSGLEMFIEQARQQQIFWEGKGL